LINSKRESATYWIQDFISLLLILFKVAISFPMN